MHIWTMTLQEWMELKKTKDDALAKEVTAVSGVPISRSQINRIRRGKSTPSLKTARALEVVTKIPASNFVMGEAA